MRPDYCPIGGEPCQSLCLTPCGIIKKKQLSKKEIYVIVLKDHKELNEIKKLYEIKLLNDI